MIFQARSSVDEKIAQPRTCSNVEVLRKYVVVVSPPGRDNADIRIRVKTVDGVVDGEQVCEPGQRRCAAVTYLGSLGEIDDGGRC